MEANLSTYFVGIPGGLIMSLIAFSIVFIVVTGLMFIMMALKYVCQGANKQKAAETPVAPAAPAAPAQPAKAVAVPTQAPAAPSCEDEGVLLAVITAAITAMCGSAARVISYAPVKAPAVSGWKFMSKAQNVEGFQD